MRRGYSLKFTPEVHTRLGWVGSSGLHIGITQRILWDHTEDPLVFTRGTPQGVIVLVARGHHVGLEE